MANSPVAKPGAGGEQPQAPWKEHKRPDGSSALDFGKGPIDRKRIDQLCERVRREYKGHPLDLKAAKLKELLEQCNDGDNSATALTGGGRGEENPMAGFAEKIKQIPKSFDDFVPISIKEEGDRILTVAQKVGYPIDAYNVAKSDYADLLREGANKIIYHQYADHPEHGEELMRRMGKLGISVPFDIVPVATVVAWKDSWHKDSTIKLEKIDGQTFGRSVQYAIAFSPQETSEADKLIKFFQKNANHKAKDGVAHSWKTPDIRSSFEESVGEFDQVILNAKPSEHDFELLFLNKEPIDGFRASVLWVNKELSKLAKALSVLWLAPVSKPLIVGRMNKAITKISYYGNGRYIGSRAAAKSRFSIAIKAVPGGIKPGHEYIRREGTQGNYKYTYEGDKDVGKKQEIRQVMREEQTRGRKPMMSEEAREQTTKRLREMRELLKTGQWSDIAHVLTAYGVKQGSPEWTLAEEAFREHRKRGFS